ncbi:diadenylate cyclase CdaA [Peptostreptococcus stomatis]|uniref:diadenylate cyclase CdaA n=1 Tax=Peptostreptococcus stomatis TaxID=341694 RepID=UPI001A5BD368|nr:diadenylate cyclase CdaA [Peptostreptococcus stomatis]MBL6466437.1 TIGR00159 family protein [Peptostreptococcus stomatis]
MLSFDLIFNKFFQLIYRISINDVVDILIVAYLFYKILRFIKDTRAEQLFKGVIILLIATQVSGMLKLHTLYWILVKILEAGFILPFIIFQPELRAGLEHLGRNTNLFRFGTQAKSAYELNIEKMISEMLGAVYDMAGRKIGALLVLEGKTKLNEIVETGTEIDAKITKQILCNIFIPNTPLHDGAVIVRDGKIKSAACFLPLTQRKDLSKDLGTRHRAGIGVSEISDSLTLIVSEETGHVSIARSGKIYRDVSKERLANILRNFYKNKTEDKTFSLVKDIFNK